MPREDALELVGCVLFPVIVLAGVFAGKAAGRYARERGLRRPRVIAVMAGVFAGIALGVASSLALESWWPGKTAEAPPRTATEQPPAATPRDTEQPPAAMPADLDGGSTRSCARLAPRGRRSAW